MVLTRKWDHELFELVFILAKLHHEQTTESCVEDRPTSHVAQHWPALSVRIDHAQEREVLALQRNNSNDGVRSKKMCVMWW